MSGKQFGRGNKKYVDRREAKSFEIKRALTHRARLRKSYFKLLEKEGIPQPRQDQQADEEKDASGIPQRDTQLELDVELGTDEVEKRNLPQRNNSRTNDKTRQPFVHPQRSRLTFAEKAKIAKERKNTKRQERLQLVQDRRRLVELKQRERELLKVRLTKTTKNGQPLMGPRINNLLDKIRKDIT